MKNKEITKLHVEKLLEQKKTLKLLAKIKLARISFWEFCKAIDPKFFTEDKEYLKDLCDKLEYFLECPTTESDVFILSMPPRSGKTYVLILFEVYCKCKHPKSKSLIFCYNQILSMNFSKTVRGLIGTPKMSKYRIVVNDIFPNVKLKKGANEQGKWSLEGSSQVNFLATSPTGTYTGMAAAGKGGFLTIDDLIRDAYTALNERLLENQWETFRMSMMSRREKGSKMIICFTRWSPKDLIGRYEEYAKNVNKSNITRVIYKMEQEDGSPLHTSIMSKEEMEERKELVGELIWKANYQQEPESVGNKLYTNIQAYVRDEKEKTSNCEYVAPKHNQFKKIYCIVDVADKGTDSSCAIAFAVDYMNNKIVILDVLYTSEKLALFQYTLPEFLHKNDVSKCIIEDNMGGSLFVSDVQKNMRNMYRNEYIEFETFTQRLSKDSRITKAAPSVERLCRFPYEMFTRYEDGKYYVCQNKQWKEFMDHILSFTNVEDMEHDDAEDTISMVVEFCTMNQLVQ